MWNRGGEGVALLMMIMHSLSTTFFEIFCGFFRGVPQGHLFHCVGDAAPYNGLSVVGCRGWRTPRVLVSLRPRQPEIGKFFPSCYER